MRKQGQGNARKWRSFGTSQALFFAAKIMDCFSFVFIQVHNKRLVDPSVLSSDVYVCFRIPGTPPWRGRCPRPSNASVGCMPPCRFLHVENHMTQVGHHTLTFKVNSSPFQEKSFTHKFRHERTTQSKFSITNQWKSNDIKTPIH